MQAHVLEQGSKAVTFALRELIHRAAPTVHVHLSRGEVSCCLRVFKGHKKQQRLLVLMQGPLRTGKE